jgi:hypothetical protein
MNRQSTTMFCDRGSLRSIRARRLSPCWDRLRAQEWLGAELRFPSTRDDLGEHDEAYKTRS